MATVIEKKSQTRRIPDNRVTIYGVTWKEYLGLLRTFAERRLRITYDEGTLEIMTLTEEHEWLTHIWGMLVMTLAVELRQPIRGYRSMTFKRKSKDKGLEPDECYWIQNESKVRGKQRFDFDKVSPPDLVLEIDITSSSIDRIDMYEKMAVPEVWHWDTKELSVLLLDENGHYAKQAKGRAFPGLTIADLLPFVEKADKEGETEGILAFQDWVREQIKNNWPDSGKTETIDSKKKTPKPKGPK
jgi:Uma2 family endonuclease